MQMKKMTKLALAAAVAFATMLGYGKSKSIVIAGETIEPGDTLTFDLNADDLPETIKGQEILTEFLPNGVEVEWTGKKFKTPKSASPKVKKIDGEYEIVVKEKGEDNPSALKVSYKGSTRVKGSFKIYTTYEKKGKPKIKSYSVSFTGRPGVSDGINVSAKKAAISCTATLQ